MSKVFIAVFMIAAAWSIYVGMDKWAVYLMAWAIIWALSDIESHSGK